MIRSKEMNGIFAAISASCPDFAESSRPKNTTPAASPFAMMFWTRSFCASPSEEAWYSALYLPAALISATFASA